MIQVENDIFNIMVTSPVRQIRARVELYDNSSGSTILDSFTHDDRLKSFQIDKIGAEKFFGFGVCSRLSLKLIDTERKLNITTSNTFDIALGVEGDYLYVYPLFFVSEVNYDEVLGEWSITAYDVLYKATRMTVAEVDIKPPYTLRAFATAAASALGMPLKIVGNVPQFDLYYEQGGNFSADTTLRAVLDAIAEVTGTVYYQCNNWCLTFARLDKDGEAVLDINKDVYFNLSDMTNRRLGTIAHITELGDNVSASISQTGTTQYLRNNPWLDLRDDVAEILNSLLADLGGFTISQFDCEWRGNYLTEIGDKITLTTKTNEVFYSYLLNTSIYYDGTYSETSEWSFISDDEDYFTTPSNLTDIVSNTYARVDKINKEITLFAGETEEKFAQFKLTTDEISSIVADLETTVDGNKTELESQITQRVDEISQTITQLETKVDGNKTELESNITQRVDEISSTVSQLETTIDGNKTELESTITQTADSIRSEITAQGETITSIQQDLDGIELTYNSTNGTASITIGDITVSNLVDGNYVNRVVSGIELTGYVKFSDLSTSGSTVINGDNITTGTINADRINMTGAISWGDLSSSCKNTIASYAGSDGADAILPEYIKSTYIDETTIISPFIQAAKIHGAAIYGGTIRAGTGSSGYVTLSDGGLNYTRTSGANVIGMGYYSGNYNYPYIIFGAGVDDVGSDRGMIKKYSNGIWIGDSDAMTANNPSGTGLFIDFTTYSVYFYTSGSNRKALASP